MSENIEVGAGKESGLKSGLPARALAWLLGATAATSVLAGQDRAEVLALLHDGRFSAAEKTLERKGTATPEDLFFQAFTTYWRLVFDDVNDPLRARLDEQLTATIAAAEAMMDDPGQASDAALWAGSSHLLLAELRASQRRPLAAAYEAKKAKRLLESSAVSSNDKIDAGFALGTYNYLADIVPAYVKGLRALLFLPKGNRALGLEQLEAAAGSSRYFALEARGLLVTFYSNKHERRYAQAVEERNRLLAAFPDSIATAYASARLDIGLGRNEAALSTLAKVEVLTHTLADVDPVVLRSIDLLRARAELAALRPDLAGATASRALRSGAGVTSDIKDDLVGVRDAAARQADGIPWPTTRQDATPTEEAERFSTLAKAHPDRPLLALLAGDASLRSRHADDALTWFSRAVDSGLPAELQAGCRFRQGQAQDLLGRRSEAKALYASVAEAPGFPAKDGAYYYQQSPYGSAP